MKITIIGNSVALRVRPPIMHPGNRNYTYLLREMLGELRECQVENKSIGAQTIINLQTNLDHYINSFPNWYIINAGVVDACSRDVPLWLYRIVTRKTQTYGYRFLRMIYYSRFMSTYRKYFVRLRLCRPWVSSKRFASEYEALVSTLLKETNAKIIIIPINPANDRIEEALPRSRDRQMKYNNLIFSIAKNYGAYLVNIDDLKSEIHYPDGVHYNTRGHEIIADRIGRIIMESLG